MPIYQFQCKKCKKKIELLILKNVDDIPLCPDCGHDMMKLISLSSFRLYGKDWSKPSARGEYGENPGPKEPKKVKK